MKEKINIAELLKDCPMGTKLYSPIFGDVYLEKIRPHLAVIVTTKGNAEEEFLYDGRYGVNGECVLFPSKENRDWSTFQRLFKDGDIVFSGFDLISIYKEQIGEKFSRLHSYVSLRNSSVLEIDKDCWTLEGIRFATEEEKAKLFQAIKDNGYRWNPEFKTLEKLVEPIFKVGDRVMKKCGASVPVLITRVGKDYYYSHKESFTGVISIAEQDDWVLVPNKFDINTLKPFESRVLVRSSYGEIWRPAIYGFTDSEKHYVVGGNYWTQCIPYEVNKELLGTTNNPE